MRCLVACCGYNGIFFNIKKTANHWLKNKKLRKDKGRERFRLSLPRAL
jgi:hypothetical protein